MKAVGRLLSYTFGLIALILLIVGISTQDIAIMSIAAFCAWGMALLGAFSASQKNVIYIFFLFTFFLFLLSRVMVRWIQFHEVYAPFPIENMRMIYACLVVSCFGLAIGNASTRYHFVLRKRQSEACINDKSTPKSYGGAINLPLLGQISAAFSIVCGFATLIVVIERIIFWSITGSGDELRISFNSALPEIILRLSYVYIMVFCIYLATLPEKKKCMLIIIQYILISALRLLYGSRFEFLVGLMFIMIYFLMRDKLNVGCKETAKKWFGKKELFFTIVSIPLLIILVVFIQYYRTQNRFEFKGMFETLGEFFESQGTSINIIGYTDVYKDGFTQPKFLYLFDRTYTILTTNPISRVFTGRRSYQVNTVERALYGTSLAMSLYYQVNPASYLAGRGAGSSYVAEAWLGYGYVGLFLVNLILARIMKTLNDYKFKKFIPTVISLIYIQSLFIMPRSGFDAFIDDFVSITHFFAIFLIWVFYKIINDRNRKWRGNCVEIPESTSVN